MNHPSLVHPLGHKRPRSSHQQTSEYPSGSARMHQKYSRQVSGCTSPLGTAGFRPLTQPRPSGCSALLVEPCTALLRPGCCTFPAGILCTLHVTPVPGVDCMYLASTLCIDLESQPLGSRCTSLQGTESIVRGPLGHCTSPVGTLCMMSLSSGSPCYNSLFHNRYTDQWMCQGTAHRGNSMPHKSQLPLDS